MTDKPFDIYTHTMCGSGGDVPDWMFYAICALPFVLVLIDALS